MELSTFLLAVFLLELTPGPNMAYLATLALSQGRRAGLIATAGVACGLAVHAIVAGLGAGVLIQEYPLLYGVRADRRRLSLYLAWRAGKQPMKPHQNVSGMPRTRALSSCAVFFQTSFNPKSILFSSRCFPPYRHDGWRAVVASPDGRVWSNLCRRGNRHPFQHRRSPRSCARGW